MKPDHIPPPLPPIPPPDNSQPSTPSKPPIPLLSSTPPPSRFEKIAPEKLLDNLNTSGGSVYQSVVETLKYFLNIK